MLKRVINFKDFEGNPISREYRFHMSEAELMELEMSENGGWDSMVKQAANTQDGPKLIEIFKKMILLSYGEISTDDVSFIKVRDGHKLAEDFMQTNAYSVLFMELATDAKKASEFVNGVIPSDLAEKVAKEADAKKHEFFQALPEKVDLNN